MRWHPLKFRPVYQERVWGGRRLESVFGRRLPAGCRIGESWEVSDRSGAESVVDVGWLAGRTLRELMALDPCGLWGRGALDGVRFPWLCKLLDAGEDVSFQVHPPACVAARFGGEPKTELWFVAEADPGACVWAGVQPGVTPGQLERCARDGTVSACVRRIPVSAGDALFVPSGRLHALGKGVVIFEIQQNSDTTYRVFDWNRLGLDGKPRQLHLVEALACIDFGDTRAALIGREWSMGRSGCRVRELVRDPAFRVEHLSGSGTVSDPRPSGMLTVVAVVRGGLRVEGGGLAIGVGPGDFVLLPGGMEGAAMEACAGSEWLEVTPGDAGGAG